jgi:uncharacterized membrane protein YdbT with pleckstrin-like domain
MTGDTASTGEHATYSTRLHWIVFAPPLLFFVAGLVAAPFQPPAAIVLLLASAVSILGAYVRYATTEILITERRVVYRTGFFSRSTIEMNKDKIESIDVSQSVLGRILGFGAVMVKGTGGGIEGIENVAAPFDLRNHVAALGSGPPVKA